MTLEGKEGIHTTVPCRTSAHFSRFVPLTLTLRGVMSFTTPFSQALLSFRRASTLSPTLKVACVRAPVNPVALRAFNLKTLQTKQSCRRGDVACMNNERRIVLRQTRLFAYR